jgi:hypothetical protein
MIGTIIATKDNARSRKPIMSTCWRFDRQCWALGKGGSANQQAMVAIVLEITLIAKTHR